MAEQQETHPKMSHHCWGQIYWQSTAKHLNYICVPPTMKLLGLIELSLILILTSQGQSWNITVTRYINAQWGSEVTIPCVFTYPAKHHTENVQVYWKKPGRSNFVTGDKDVNSFVFHPNDTYVLEKYRRKTMLIGNKNNGNCSLRILNVTDNEPELYMRLIGKGEKYSFRKDFVSLFVYDVTPATFNPEIARHPFHTTESMSTAVIDNKTTSMYMTIFVPVSALLIIVLTIGTFCCIKHKRSQSLTREGSGYYANCSRASANQAKSEASSTKHENKKLPNPKKATDEPVYANIAATAGQVDQSVDHTDNIYVNLTY